MMNEMTDANEELASAIFAGIEYPMSAGNGKAVEKQLINLGRNVRGVEAYIIDPSGQIIFSTHQDRLAGSIGKHLAAPETARSLVSLLKTEAEGEQTIEDRAADHRFFVHVRKLLNGPQCIRCHDAGKRVLGAIILRKPAEKQYAALVGILKGNLLVSAIGIFAVIMLTHALLMSFFSKPISNLAGRIKKLPEMMSNGVDLPILLSKRTDEIGELENAFALMAMELNDKTIAIQETSTELEKANKELEAFAYSVSHICGRPCATSTGFRRSCSKNSRARWTTGQNTT